MEKWIEEFVELFFQIDKAKSDIKRALQIKYKNTPNKIFKYRYVNPSSLKNLEDDTVWQADPLSFNDPYDCAMLIDDKTSISNIFIRNNFDRFISENNQSIQQIKKEVIESARKSKDPLTEILNSLNLQESEIQELRNMDQKIYDSYINKYIKIHRICSFSKERDSLLMWSHYSEHHKGFCIEYSLDVLPENSLLITQLFPVIYSRSIYDTKTILEHQGKDYFNQFMWTLAAITKSEDWKYEKEWRLISVSKTPIQPFKMPKPTAIYLGTRFDVEDPLSEEKRILNKRLLEIISTKNIPCYKMSLSTTKFELIPNHNKL